MRFVDLTHRFESRFVSASSVLARDDNGVGRFNAQRAIFDYLVLRLRPRLASIFLDLRCAWR